MRSYIEITPVVTPFTVVPPSVTTTISTMKHIQNSSQKVGRSWIVCGNDPSAGSPTETLLRLLLPLDNKV